VNLIELVADEDKDFLLVTLALKFPKVMLDVKRVFLANRLPYSGVPIPLSEGARYTESLLGLASCFPGGYSEMTDKYPDRYCCVAVVSYTKLFDDRMKYVCLCNSFSNNCRYSGEILVRDNIGDFRNQLHHSVLNNDPSRNTIDLPDSFREDLTELEQLPQDLKDRFVNNLSKNQLNRAVEFAGRGSEPSYT
jgi:hypothetical protein